MAKRRARRRQLRLIRQSSARLKAQLFSFPEIAFQSIAKELGDQLQHSLLGSGKVLEVGSLFSGMGTMEQALTLIRKVCRKHGLPFDFRPNRYFNTYLSKLLLSTAFYCHLFQDGRLFGDEKNLLAAAEAIWR